MSRAYVTYFCVFAFCIAGLWVILTFGRSIEAPPDIAGDWRVKWERPPKFSPAETVMKIEQSGRFINVTFGASERLRMKLDDPNEIRQELRNPVLKMRNGIWMLTLVGNLHGEVRVILSGPTTHRGTAIKIDTARTPANNVH